MADSTDIAAVLSSVGSVAGAVLAWVSGYQLLVAIFSAFLVALLTFQFNSRMQTKAWKREIAIKRTGELYGPLYMDLLTIIRTFSRGQPQSDTVAGGYSSGLWRDIVGDYRYRVLPEEMRKQLDELYKLVSVTSLQWESLTRLCDEVVFGRTSHEAGLDIAVLNWVVSWTKIGLPPQAQAFHPAVALAQGESIMSYVKRTRPGDSYRFFLQVELKGAKELTEVPFDLERVGRIFAQMEREVTESPISKEYSKNAQEIVAKGTSLRESIGLIVEQPWRG